MERVPTGHDDHAGDEAQSQWNLPVSLDVSDGSGVSLGSAPPSLSSVLAVSCNGEALAQESDVVWQMVPC